MTTINNSHLIEKVGGIEKAREIVSGAPEHAMAKRSLGEGEYLGTYELKQNIPEAILEAERHG